MNVPRSTTTAVLQPPGPRLVGVPHDATGTWPDYPHVGTIATLFFCGYVVFWYLQVSYRIPALGAMRAEFIYGALLGVVAIQRGASLRSPVTGFLVLLLACMAIQVPLSYNPIGSYNVFVDRVLKFFSMALFIVAFVKSPRTLKWFLAAFLLACFKMGQEGLVGQITGSLVWQNQGVMRLHGATPNYEHPNSFAGMALGTLPFVLFLYPVADNKKTKLFLIIMAVLAGNIILFTGSRTGYIGFAGFVLLLLVRAKSKIRHVAITALVVVLALPLIPAEYLERFQSIFTGVDKEGESTKLRREILTDAWQVFLAHPLGIGVDAFPVVRQQMFRRSQDTHNLYLQIATNLGVQGLVVFMAFIAVLLRLLSRLAAGFDEQISVLTGAGPPRTDPERAPADEHVADLMLMRQTALAVQTFIIIRLILGLFGMDLYEIYWWFAMAVAIALFKMDEVARQRTISLRGRRLSTSVVPLHPFAARPRALAGHRP